MKRISKFIVSLAIIATYVGFATQALADPDFSGWQGAQRGGGASVSGGFEIKPTDVTTIWDMTNMNIPENVTGRINTELGAKNVYAHITGGQTVWNGIMNAQGVNFAAFNDAGFLIGPSGVVNAAALTLTTTPLNAANFLNNNGRITLNGATGEFDTTREQQDAFKGKIINKGHINADAVILAARGVENKANLGAYTLPSTAQIVGQTVRVAAGDNISLDLDLSGVSTSTGIAFALADPNLNIAVTGDNGYVYNSGQIVSTGVALDSDTNGIGVGIHESGKGGVHEYADGTQEPYGVYNVYRGVGDDFAQISTTNGRDIVIETDGDGADLLNSGFISNQGFLYGQGKYTNVDHATAATPSNTKLTMATKGSNASVKFIKTEKADGELVNCGRIITHDLGIDSKDDINFDPNNFSELDVPGTIDITSDDGTVTLGDPTSEEDTWTPTGPVVVDAGEDIINEIKIDTDKPLDWTAGRDIVNNDVIDTTAPLDWDAGRDIINNDDIALDGPNAKADWDAGRDIVNNDDIAFDNGAGADWDAGRNIVNNSKDDPYGDNPNSVPGDGKITNNGDGPLDFTSGTDPNKYKDDPQDGYTGDIINRGEVANLDDGPLDWKAGRHVINDPTGVIKTGGEGSNVFSSGNEPDFNAGDIINNGWIGSDPNATTPDKSALVFDSTPKTKDGKTSPGGYIVQNGTVDLKNGGDVGDITNPDGSKPYGDDAGNAIAFKAGKSIITTDPESYAALKDAGVKVRPDGNGKRDPQSGNAITKIAPTDNGILAEAADDIINNGLTALETPEDAPLTLDAGGFIIQNNELAAKTGGPLNLKAGKDIITTDTPSRNALKAAGIDPNSTTPALKDLKFVSSKPGNSIKDPNGNAVTGLDIGDNPMDAVADRDVINNGITMIKGKNPKITAGRHVIQNNVLTFVDPNAAEITAGTKEPGDVMDMTQADRDAFDDSPFVSKTVKGPGAAESVTNIIGTGDTPATLAMKAQNGGAVKNRGKINVDAKKAIIMTPDNDFEIAGEINADEAFTLPDVADGNTYIFGNDSVFADLAKDRTPSETPTTLQLDAAANDLVATSDADIHGYNIYLTGKDLKFNNTKPTAINKMSTYSDTVTFSGDNSGLQGKYTTVHTKQNIDLAGNDSSLNLGKIRCDKELTLYSDLDVNVNGDTALASGDKVTVAAKRNVNVAPDKVLLLNTSNPEGTGYVYADNAVNNNGSLQGNHNLAIGGDTVNTNGGTAVAGVDLAIYSKAGQKHSDSGLAAGRHVRLQTDSPINLISDVDSGEVDAGYFSGIGGTGLPTAFANTLELQNSTVAATNNYSVEDPGNLNMHANDVIIDSTNASAAGNVTILADNDIVLKGGSTTISAGKNIVMKADADHYTKPDQNGVIINNTGKEMANVLSAPNGKWNVYSNATQALKDDPTLYVYDQNNADYVRDDNRIIFYGIGNDEVPPDRRYDGTLDDASILHSVTDLPEEKTVWKRFDNKVDQTKMEVNNSVNRFMQADQQFVPATGAQMINGVSKVKEDNQVGYYEDEE